MHRREQNRRSIDATTKSELTRKFFYFGLKKVRGSERRVFQPSQEGVPLLTVGPSAKKGYSLSRSFACYKRGERRPGHRKASRRQLLSPYGHSVSDYDLVVRGLKKAATLPFIGGGSRLVSSLVELGKCRHPRSCVFETNQLLLYQCARK